MHPNHLSVESLYSHNSDSKNMKNLNFIKINQIIFFYNMSISVIMVITVITVLKLKITELPIILHACNCNNKPTFV